MLVIILKCIIYERWKASIYLAYFVKVTKVDAKPGGGTITAAKFYTLLDFSMMHFCNNFSSTLLLVIAYILGFYS